MRHTHESGLTVDLNRDRHGNLRLVDFDSSKVDWPEEKRADRRVRRERQVRRAVKYFNPE